MLVGECIEQSELVCWQFNMTRFQASTTREIATIPLPNYHWHCTNLKIHIPVTFSRTVCLIFKCSKNAQIYIFRKLIKSLLITDHQSRIKLVDTMHDKYTVLDCLQRIYSFLDLGLNKAGCPHRYNPSLLCITSSSLYRSGRIWFLAPSKV